MFFDTIIIYAACLVALGLPCLLWYYEVQFLAPTKRKIHFGEPTPRRCDDRKDRKHPPPPPEQFLNMFETWQWDDHKDRPLVPLASYRLSNEVVLTIAHGPITSFASPAGAIVTAGNEMLAGGGGVDRAILKAGGAPLQEDRMKMPLRENKNGVPVKCPTGKARITGPNKYHKLKVDRVIHAVGPNFNDPQYAGVGDYGKQQLKNAYRNALSLTKDHPISQIAFPLISSGIYRGTHDLYTVTLIAIRAINSWSTEPSIEFENHCKDIVFCAYTIQEANMMLEMCDHVLSGHKKIHPV